MSIVYPLVMPSYPAPVSVKLAKVDAVGETISPFDGSAQEQQWQDQHFELELAWPPMTRDQADPIDAFLMALHGKYGTFLWGDPLRTVPQGTAQGTPKVNGSNASGINSLATKGWLPGQGKLLLPGDYLQVTAPGGPRRLYINLTAAASDGGGNATLDIFPSIRETLPDGTSIVLVATAGTFRLADNRREWSADKTRTFVLSLKAREAI